MINPFLLHTNTAILKFKGNHKLQKLIHILSLLLFGLIIISCDEIGNEVIEQSKFDYKMIAISAPSNFVYSASDSILQTSVQFENSKSISGVWLSIKSQDGKIIISSRSDLFDDGNVQKNGDVKSGDNIYSAKIGISRKFSSGKYNIEYFLEDNVRRSPENVTKVASQIFTYNNNQTPYPPVISNLSIPGSVNRGESFIFTVKADDPNGLSDIAQVYFKLYRPDGTIVDPQNGLGYFLMVDDGNFDVFGDQTAGDGIFSYKNSFLATSAVGKWRFEFQAIDRSNKTSNTIIHEMSVN